MKKKPTIHLLSFALVVFLTCCGEQESGFQPLSGGFGVVTKWVGIDSGPGAKLMYKDKNGHVTLIWPFLGTSEYPILFHNDMAFFIADMPDSLGRMGRERYFAVSANGPVIDVSDDLLKSWLESQKRSFVESKTKYSPLRIMTNGVDFQIHYAGDANQPVATFDVTWNQVSNIIREAKRKGMQHKIQKPAVTYVKIDYDSLSYGN